MTNIKKISKSRQSQRKNPPKKITSTEEFKSFMKLLKDRKLNYLELVQFGEKFSTKNLIEAEDLSDLAAIFYLKGLIKGYSTSYHTSREYAHAVIYETIRELDDKIAHLFKLAKIPPYRKVRL
jgi:hypothetical protein